MNKFVKKDGMVEFIMPAGKDFVKSKMPEIEAQKIIDNAQTTKISHRFDGFNLYVDKKYYFQTERVKKDEKE